MPTILRLLRSPRPLAYPSLTPLSSSTQTTTSTPIRTFTSSLPRSAGPKESSGDYGSGTGDPAGETPQKQGTSQTSRSQEHPGPESPVSSGSSGNKDAQQGSSGGGDGGGNGGQGKRSKIADHDISMEADRVESDDVKQHNKEMSQRFDRASEQSGAVEDKVDKGFWSGQGGRDRDP